MLEILPAIHLFPVEHQSSAQPKDKLATHLFITSRFTFCMSTFWLNSGGNFVDFSILASTEVAMLWLGLHLLDVVR